MNMKRFIERVIFFQISVVLLLRFVVIFKVCLSKYIFISLLIWGLRLVLVLRHFWRITSFGHLSVKKWLILVLGPRKLGLMHMGFK